MNRSPGRLARWTRKRAAGDAGFTLIEIIISVSLLGLITGAATASMVTATSAARSTSQSAHESADAQLISAFLVRDAQAAGGSNPVTGAVDASIGVTVDHDALGNPAPIAPIDAADVCTPTNTKVRFTWFDRVSKAVKHPNVASYALNTVTHELVRRSCRDGVSSGDMVLGSKVANAVGTCVPAAKCPGLPNLITVTITATNDPGYSATPFTYDLSAQLRPQAQDKPDKFTAAPSPLFALGGGGCPSPSGAYINVSGTSSLEVQVGGAIVNSAAVGCDSLHVGGAGSYSADSTSLLAGGVCTGTCPSPITYFPQKYDDPLAGLLTPTISPACGGGGNPAPAGSTYAPDVYNVKLKILSASTFLPGTYVFCDGLDIKASVDAPGVLFYFAGGTLDVNASGAIKISAQLSGDWEGVAIWQPQSLGVKINGIAGLQSYEGIVYAPLSIVSLSGNADFQIGTIIARAIDLGGGGHAAFGPGVTITTPVLPDALVGVPYSLIMEAAGGTAYDTVTIPHKYRPWELVSGLPGWSMTIDGVLSGTPSAVTDYDPVIIAVTDSSTPVPIRVERRYKLHVGSGSLAIVTPPMLSAATLNTAYSKPLLASGGSGSYNWSWKPSTTPPAWLSITAGGVLSGTPPGPTGTVTVPVRVSLASDPLVFVDRDFSLLVNPLPVIPPQTFAATTVGAVGYSATMVATPGTGTAPFKWSIPPGTLPPGLDYNPDTGAIFGTPSPTAAINALFDATVTDANFATATRPLSILVNAAPSITAPATPTLPGWATGAGAYPPVAMTVTGGTGLYTWALAAGALPAGLSLSAAGVISGTPTSPVTNGPITVRVTDSVGVSAIRTYSSFTITGPLSIAPSPSLPSWDAGVAYPTTTPTAGGGSGGYVWSSTTLPPGLVIDSGTGAITGTPTTDNLYTTVLTVTDSNGVVATRSYSINVYKPLAYTGPGSLPNWVSDIAYPAQTLTASGGGPSKTWSATGLPPGLSVSAGGVLSGTPSPTGIGTYSAINFSVSDGAGGGIAVGPFSLTIFPALGISTAGVPSAGVVGVPYSGSPAAGGGSGTFSWSATGLPAGVTMSSAGALSGSPTTNSTYSVNFTVTDNGTGAGGQRASVTVSGFIIKTYQPLAWGTLPTPPSAWTANFIYPTQNFPTSGGLPSISWSATGLPIGMSINTATGAIAGVPTAVGTTTVTVTAKDALNQTVTRTFSLTINPAIAVSGLSGSVTRGVPYSSIVSATGGTGTLIWSSSSPLPAGLTWNVATRTVSGTPSSSGSWVMTVTATDSVGATGSQTQNVLIQPTVTSVAFVNGTGNNAPGQMEKGDSIVITFSDDILSSTLCSAPWAVTSSDVVVQLNDGGTANDTITFKADGTTGCVPSIGTINLNGTGFATGNIVFGGASSGRSTMVLTTTTVAPIRSTLTINLGTAGLAVGNGNVNNIMGSFTGLTANAVYNPNNPTTVISDPRGAFISGTATIAPTGAPPNGKFF
jgi:prepilin-type N-terminal cleavage/methylation domain-containing protein